MQTGQQEVLTAAFGVRAGAQAPGATAMSAKAHKREAGSAIDLEALLHALLFRSTCQCIRKSLLRDAYEFNKYDLLAEPP